MFTDICCFRDFFFDEASSTPLLLLLVEFCCWNIWGGCVAGYMSSTLLNINSLPRTLTRFKESRISSCSCWSQFGLDVALTVVDWENDNINVYIEMAVLSIASQIFLLVLNGYDPLNRKFTTQDKRGRH